MKKIVLSMLMLGLMVSIGQAQTKINESFDVGSLNQLSLVFEYPELVQIKTWKGKEVKIEGTVDIQNGTSDEDFEIKTYTKKGKFIIESEIKGLDKKRSKSRTYRDGNTSVMVDDKGTTIRRDDDKASYVNGVRVSITVVVTIPEDMKVELDARYGLVEVLENPATLIIDARFGGVDVVIDEAELLKLDAATQWGQIFSNLQVPVNIKGDDGLGKWMTANASLKKGAQSLSIASQYGNVYLRKN